MVSYGLLVEAWPKWLMKRKVYFLGPEWFLFALPSIFNNWYFSAQTKILKKYTFFKEEKWGMSILFVTMNFFANKQWQYDDDVYGNEFPFHNDLRQNDFIFID